MTITKINVRFPRAPIVEMIILNKTFIVVHDWANLSTRNWWRECEYKTKKNEKKKRVHSIHSIVKLLCLYVRILKWEGKKSNLPVLSLVKRLNLRAAPKKCRKY